MDAFSKTLTAMDGGNAGNAGAFVSASVFEPCERRFVYEWAVVSQETERTTHWRVGTSNLRGRRAHGWAPESTCLVWIPVSSKTHAVCWIRDTRGRVSLDATSETLDVSPNRADDSTGMYCLAIAIGRIA